MTYALNLNNVSKKYKNSNFYLDNISFSVPSGSIMGFVGENGAGKTTTISCILNTLSIDSGSIKILGKQMNNTNTKLKEEIGVVYDGDNFPSYLSAGQISNIMSCIYTKWDESLFQSFLNRFKLNEKQKIEKYSKGMTMKLAIAVALSHNPKLLILDEATSGLDPIMRDEILDIFLDFVSSEEHSILLSSHITSDLEKIADYITFIHDGKIILSDKKDNLIYDYAILRCSEKQFNEIDKDDIISYQKKDYQINVLVNNKKKQKIKYPNIVIDNPTIDEIMLLLVRGEHI